MTSVRKLAFMISTGLLVAAILPACSALEPDSLHMIPVSQLPAEVQAAPLTVRTAYQFAAGNPDLMQHIPCYCGCGDIGHGSNYECYVSRVDASGNITFDNHALGCSICVDITLDVMRMLEDGKSQEEARAYIDATYSRYGPSNFP